MIGVGIIAMDRPQYLNRLIASLEQQKGAGPVEYHLFQDGIDNVFSGRTVADETGWRRVYRCFDSCKLEPKWIHCNVENWGIALHQFNATDYMAGHYSHVMMVEDDVVLSPYWLRLVRVLFDQFAGRDDVFGFCPGFKRLGQNLDTVRFESEHWWCEAFTGDAWRRMLRHYRDYMAFVNGTDYGQRDNEAIREWMDSLSWGNPSTSQDSGKDMAIWRSGMRRVVCEVNRAIGIGRTGVHFSPALFNRLGYEGQLPYTFAEDATRIKFDGLVN